jgi:hypothetical protein
LVAKGSIAELIRQHGGIPTTGGRVTGATTVLVRGHSPTWYYGKEGKKERYATELIRRGLPLLIIDDVEFQTLIERGRPARVLDQIAGEPLDFIKPVSQKTFESIARISGPLDKERIGKARLEQGYLRQRLFGASGIGRCSLCGCEMPVSLLRAAHIKPRSECTHRERRDAANIVFAACLLGCDSLYEQGLLSVGLGGKIVCTRRTDSKILRTILSKLRGKTCLAWHDSNATYFKWHKGERFQC